MVLGNGMIASALKMVDRPEVLFAASGLSNSKGADPKERLREEKLIQEQIQKHPDQIFVYISSYSIDEAFPQNNTPYLSHKLNMENLVKRLARQFLIIRTSNVVGKSRQPGNLMNFIFNNLKQGTPFEVWTGTSRNLIDVQDLAQMVSTVVENGFINQVLYLIHPADMPIYDIVRHFEQLSGLKGNYALVEKGVHYGADNALSVKLFKMLHLQSDPDLYACNLIQKYFGSFNSLMHQITDVQC